MIVMQRFTAAELSHMLLLRFFVALSTTIDPGMCSRTSTHPHAHLLADTPLPPPSARLVAAKRDPVLLIAMQLFSFARCSPTPRLGVQTGV